MKRLAGGVVLGVLALLCLVLVLLLAAAAQVRVTYSQGELTLRAGYGPLSVRLYPPEPKKEKRPKKAKKKKEQEPEEEEKSREKRRLSITSEQILYTLETLPPILSRALGRMRRGIRIQPLKLHLLIAGEDPAGTALLYGRAQAALAAGMPFLRQAVHIREEDIRLFLDFQRTQPDCIADIGVSMRCGTAAGIFLRAGGSLVKWILGFRKLAPPSRKKPAEEKQQNAGAA